MKIIDKMGKRICRGDIIYRPPQGGQGRWKVGDILVDGFKCTGDIFNRKYQVLRIGKHGWMEVQSIEPHHRQGWVRHHDWSTFEILSRPISRSYNNQFECWR